MNPRMPKPPTDEQLLEDVFDGDTEAAYQLAKRGTHETFVQFITEHVQPGEMNRYRFDTLCDGWDRLQDERRIVALDEAFNAVPTVGPGDE